MLRNFVLCRLRFRHDSSTKFEVNDVAIAAAADSWLRIQQVFVGGRQDHDSSGGVSKEEEEFFVWSLPVGRGFL